VNEEKERQEEGHVTQTAALPEAALRPLHLISLGAGVQSSTMSLMAAAGEITPMPDGAIFADTQDEPASVYKWLDWLEKQLPFPVHRVTSGRLSERSLKFCRTKDGRLMTRTDIPFFTSDGSGKEGKILSRACTRDFKLVPLMAKARELAGIKRGKKTVGVIQWIGISLDEMVRMKTSRDAWAENRWPLVELRMRREDCLTWMAVRHFPTPPRSACVYCPFHSNHEWRRLKDDEPEAFAQAVKFETDLQAAKAKSENFRTTPFLHRSCKPLAEVDLSTDVERGQFAWWEEGFREECEGMCGV